MSWQWVTRDVGEAYDEIAGDLREFCTTLRRWWRKVRR